MKRAVVEELGLAGRIVNGSTVGPNELQSAICSVPEKARCGEEEETKPNLDWMPEDHAAWIIGAVLSGTTVLSSPSRTKST
jgi:hypothetical protein